MDSVGAMNTRGFIFSAVLALSVSLTAVTGPADAAIPKFSSCKKLVKVYPNGVAKSRAAASRQVRAGNQRPRVSPRVYAVNKARDGDRDGTACEQRRPSMPAVPPIVSEDPPTVLDPTVPGPAQLTWVDQSTGLMSDLMVSMWTLDTGPVVRIEAPGDKSASSDGFGDRSQLTEVSTGADVPVFGGNGGYFVGSVTSAPGAFFGQLRSGIRYEFRVEHYSRSQWLCSIYDYNVCHWSEGRNMSLSTWQFTYDPAITVTGDKIRYALWQ